MKKYRSFWDLQRALCWALASSVVLWARTSSATDTFPDVIQATLMAPKRPGCDLCHVGGNGQKGNVSTPFGKAMLMFGLVENDESSLKAALAASKMANVDSDGDGVGDVDELAKGTDPNFNEVTGQPAGGDFPPPEYGCTLSHPSRGHLAPGAMLTGLLWIAVVLRARRRRSRTAAARWRLR